MSDHQRVAVVTGGGGGIGAAIAMELGRDGWFVVTVDPMVTVDGAAQVAEVEETTADRIVAAGGSARASAASVTDGTALRALFDELADERGGIDAVINVGGISRPTGYAHGSDEDWLAVINVHLAGYLNVLSAALPIMAAAGHGHIIGVTSGSGWRAADAGAYSAAKRAVASLTWQLGKVAPEGVRVNAMSPIAVTRMVTSALERAGAAGSGRGGGLDLLKSMPAPEDMGPIGAYLAGERFDWANGRIVFAGGSEVALIDEPRLLEVVRTADVKSLAGVLDVVIKRALVPAETGQATTGGGNPRFGGVFEDAQPVTYDVSPVRTCAVISDRPSLAASVTAALEAQSIKCQAVTSLGPDEFDAVVVALAGGPAGRGSGWERVLAEHQGVVDQIDADGRWGRTVAEYAARLDRPVKLVTLTDAATTGGRSRAQASAQLARIASGSTKRRVTAFTVSLEAQEPSVAGPAADLVVQLLANPEAAGLAGAELVVSDEWLGLRSHPRPVGTIVYGGPDIPDWLDTTLRELR